MKGKIIYMPNLKIDIYIIKLPFTRLYLRQFNIIIQYNNFIERGKRNNLIIQLMVGMIPSMKEKNISGYSLLIPGFY